MPLTPAEKQRRYRERLKAQDPEKYEELKRAARENTARNYWRKKNDVQGREELRRKWSQYREKRRMEASASVPSGSSAKKRVLTPAEKQRRYRERLKANPQKYEEYRKKIKERYRRTHENKLKRYSVEIKEELPQANDNVFMDIESQMSTSSDFMVKLEAEEAPEGCEPAEYDEIPIKEEPEVVQPQESLTSDDPLSSDPLRTLASFSIEPVVSDPVKCESCRICGHSLAFNSVRIGPKGLLSLQRSSERRQDGKFPPTQEKIQLHSSCRANYINEKNIQAAENKLRKYVSCDDSNAIHMQSEVDSESECRERSSIADLLDNSVSGSDALETESTVSEPSGSEYRGNEYCRICGSSVTLDAITVGHKGLASLLRTSDLRGDNKFPPGTIPPLRVHGTCRKRYTNPKAIAGYIKKLLRSEVDPDAPPLEHAKAFDYREQCLICAGDASTNKDGDLPECRKTVRRVARTETGDLLYWASLDRPGPDSEELRKRIRGKDLVGLQARYHIDCYHRLTLDLHNRQSRPSEGGKKGRPPSEAVQATFKLACDYVENNWEDSQFHLDDIQKAPGITAAVRTLEHKFPDRYGVVLYKWGSFVVTPGFKLTDDWYERRLADERDEKLRIVRTAANIILEDIRSIPFDNRTYPPSSSFLDDVGTVIPETLKTFVDTVVMKYKKEPENLSSTVTALSHSIMTAARPRTFKSPLLLGIGSFINQNRTSKNIIELLSSVGFCAPYKDVTQFEVSVACKSSKRTSKKKSFTQFAFDAVDTEINGLTTQWLVGVECVTPRPTQHPIPRREQITPKDADWWYRNAPLKTYSNGTSGLKNVAVEDHRDDTKTLPTRGDALWLFGKSESLDLPRWDAFMKSKDKHPLSEIEVLTAIRAPVSHDAVYTALKYAQQNSRGIRVVTFSQPLYEIAQEIVNSDAELNKIVLRLGGFHLMMSYLGAIGHIMSGSGLEQLWWTIYAGEQTGKMITGHAFARALRAHFLTRSALFNIITKDFDLTPEEKFEIESVLNGSDTQIDYDNLGVKKYQEPLSITLEFLEKRGPTAQLWIQYFRMTTLMAQFIEAERTGNWELHLSSLKKMLPYFHASGHFEYAKSCSMYLQDMQKLESKMSVEEFEDFTKKGYFAVRRTDKLWYDVWTDRIVEETVGRLMKRPGGVVNGRRVTDCVFSHWTEAAPILSCVADLVECFCRTDAIYADKSSRKKDNEDVAKLQKWFEEHDPFKETEKMVSIGTGVVGGSEIRCHEAEEIGKGIMAQKIGQNYHDVGYQRTSCVLPLLSVNSAIWIDSVKVPIESDTIFKRINITKDNEEEMKSYFDYELAPYPLSLFNDYGLIETRKKSEFNWFVKVEIAEGGNRAHVIDGEFLLRRVNWEEGADIMTIINNYIEYVKANFTNAVVVFEGRKETNLKPSKFKSSPTVAFQKDTVITTSQESFLSNERNREKLIQYMLIDFTRSGITVKLSPNDVNAYIVETATATASTHEETCVVSDNPDLLVIMTGLVTKKNIYFMKPGRGKKPSEYYHHDSFASNKIKLSIMFIHAVCGSGSTSKVFSKSSTNAGLAIQSIPFKYVKYLASVFKDPNADADVIAEVGYMFMRQLYHYHGDDVPVDDLSVVRFNLFRKSAAKSKPGLARLPPTEEAVRLHMYRTYHQIQKWLGNDLPATDWGWQLVGDCLKPIATFAEPVPRELLELISCKCVSMCTGECTCKRAGLDCCVLCVNCNGRVCHGIDMDPDAYEAGYRALSGSDTFGNPIDMFELTDDERATNNESDDDSEAEPTAKRPKRDRVTDKPNTVEEVYIVGPSDTSSAIDDGDDCRATRHRSSLSHCSD